MEDRITYVGLDVHKEGIVVAIAESGIRGKPALPVRHEGVRQMRASPRPKRPINVEILDVIEEGDRVDSDVKINLGQKRLAL